MAKGGAGYWHNNWFSGNRDDATKGSWWHVNWWASAVSAFENVAGDLILIELNFSSGTRYYSNVDVRHPSRLYTGKVTRFGTLRRAIPSPVGFPIIGDITVELSNADLEFTNLKDEINALRGTDGSILIGPEGGSRSNDFSVIYTGRIRAAQITGDDKLRITMQDFTFESFKSELDLAFSLADFTDLPANFSSSSIRQNIVYGDMTNEGLSNMLGDDLSRAWGAIRCPYIDVTNRGFHAAKTPVKGVDQVYVKEGDTTTLLTGGQYSIVEVARGLETHTEIRVNAGVITNINSALVTANIRGITTTGLASGTLITEPEDQLKDYMENYAGVSSSDIDTTSFTTVGLLTTERSWVGAGLINQKLTHEEVITRFLISFNFDLYVDISGKIALGLFDITTSVEALVDEDNPTPTFTEKLFMLRESFNARENNNVRNKILYSYARDFGQSTSWLVEEIYEDKGSQADIGEVITESVQFFFVRDTITAFDVVRERNFFQRHTSDRFVFGLPNDVSVINAVELTNDLKLTYESKWGEDGEPLRVVSLGFNLDELKFEVGVMRTGLADARLLSDRTDSPTTDYDLATETEQALWWYLGDRSTGQFGNGDDANIFAS